MAGAPDGITHEMMAASLDYTNAQQGNTFPHRVATLLHDLDAKTSQAPLALIEFGGPNMGRSTIGRHGMSLRAVLQFMKENIALSGFGHGKRSLVYVPRLSRSHCHPNGHSTNAINPQGLCPPYINSTAQLTPSRRHSQTRVRQQPYTQQELRGHPRT